MLLPAWVRWTMLSSKKPQHRLPLRPDPPLQTKFRAGFPRVLPPHAAKSRQMLLLPRSSAPRSRWRLKPLSSAWMMFPVKHLSWIWMTCRRLISSSSRILLPLAQVRSLFLHPLRLLLLSSPSPLPRPPQTPKELSPRSQKHIPLLWEQPHPQRRRLTPLAPRLPHPLRPPRPPRSTWSLWTPPLARRLQRRFPK